MVEINKEFNFISTFKSKNRINLQELARESFSQKCSLRFVYRKQIRARKKKKKKKPVPGVQ